MHDFLIGANALANAAIALFFLRFWHQTRDRLFLAFSLSFGLLTASRVALVISNINVEDRASFYWVRLAAYLLILFAVLDKNRLRSERQPETRPQSEEKRSAAD